MPTISSAPPPRRDRGADRLRLGDVAEPSRPSPGSPARRPWPARGRSRAPAAPRGRAPREIAAAAAAPASTGRRAAPPQPPGGPPHEQHQDPGLDQQPGRRRAPAGRCRKSSRLFKLGRAEIGSRLDRHRRGPASRGRRRSTAPSATTTAATSATGRRKRPPHRKDSTRMAAVAHRLGHPRQQARLRGRDRRCRGGRGRGAVVPRRPRRLRRRARRLRRARREHCAICLAGNHDLGVVGVLSLEDFSRGAALAAQWTQETIAPETREFLLSLSPEGGAEGVGLYHASPRDPIWEYVLSGLTAELCFDAHATTASRSSATRTSRCPSTAPRASRPPARRAARATSSTSPAGEWLINPGSTGQPRDGDPRAAWLMLDTERWTARLAARRVRHRRRAGGDPRGRPAGLARRAPSVRSIAPM